MLVTDIWPGWKLGDMGQEGLWMICHRTQCWELPAVSEVYWDASPQASCFLNTAKIKLQVVHPSTTTENELDTRSCDLHIKDPGHLLPYSGQNRPSKHILKISCFVHCNISRRKTKNSWHDSYSNHRWEITISTKQLTWFIEIHWIYFLDKIRAPHPSFSLTQMKVCSFRVTHPKQLLLSGSICWTQRESDTEEMRPPRFGTQWWQLWPLFCRVWSTPRWKSIPQPCWTSTGTCQLMLICTSLECLGFCPCSHPHWFLCGEFASLSARHVGKSSP